jgi:YtkA-like
VGVATITAELSEGAAPVTGAVVALEGDMSHPGMAPVFGTAKEKEPGRYEGHIQLTMPGDWVILEHITLADGRKLERQLDVNSVRPH